MHDDAPCTAASPCHTAPPTATQARLADACVDDGLAEAWAALLQLHLERLNLESNAVGTRGVRALAAALRVSPQPTRAQALQPAGALQPLGCRLPSMQPQPLGAAAAPQPRHAALS